jgi:hypothetical protein
VVVLMLVLVAAAGVTAPPSTAHALGVASRHRPNKTDSPQLLSPDAPSRAFGAGRACGADEVCKGAVWRAVFMGGVRQGVNQL